jgi:hypothetical protein
LSYIYVVVDGAEGAVSVHEVGKEAGVLFEKKKKNFLMGKGDQDPRQELFAFTYHASYPWVDSSFIPLIFGYYWGYHRDI